ncbi:MULTISPECIES: propionate kinase [Atlantibacter]|uniref:Acetate kinase n=1 Tax=Atlantibacter hermannii NBRC 105704 TaxID=1115512 RepID=H5V718_ATLHE|nr:MULTISPECIES: propionate kinase [Atlantibacter]MDU7391110.1 propionate kinase [Atlantibacter hermannii]MDU7814365.1 propionate kinase [Atlantibacter hermannii]MEB7924732.1 propionate kinase [Atlantibacter hermannii]QPS91247.1 propionate kinase [Atlantibacter hermannii]VDZ71668.1 propionate/acetate kinase [Atlantibacter hermannii]
MSLACVLVINCGSSSMKFSVIPQDDDQPVLSGLAERLGIDHAVITFKDRDGNKTTVALDQASHEHALSVLFARLSAQRLLETLCAIGHRVAHGGSDFKQSVLVTDEVIERIRALSALAPLHNPANLVGIEAARALLPALPQVAVFDTAFHQTLSPAAYTYAIPLEYQLAYQVRRYGFHGTSHRYIAAEALETLDLDPADHGIVIAHLGNGSSLCAVQNGESVDTSMGMTPLEGLVMGTRCGDLDFGAAAYLANCTGQPIDTLYKMVNNQSGLLGISGLSSDCRTLQQARDEGHERATLAIDVLVHRLARHIGGHVAALKRFDALIFTGGIGENSALIRELTVKRLQALGLTLDDERNQQLFGGRSGIISGTGATKIAVIPTNEEKMIAMDAAAIACTA